MGQGGAHAGNPTHLANEQCVRALVNGIQHHKVDPGAGVLGQIWRPSLGGAGMGHAIKLVDAPAAAESKPVGV